MFGVPVVAILGSNTPWLYMLCFVLSSSRKSVMVHSFIDSVENGRVDLRIIKNDNNNNNNNNNVTRDPVCSIITYMYYYFIWIKLSQSVTNCRCYAYHVVVHNCFGKQWCDDA
jgi:hypothetical protein